MMHMHAEFRSSTKILISGQNYSNPNGIPIEKLSGQIFQIISEAAWHGGTVILDLSALLAVPLSLWLKFWSLRRICHMPYWCTGRNGDWQSDISWGLSSWRNKIKIKINSPNLNLSGIADVLFIFMWLRWLQLLLSLCNCCSCYYDLSVTLVAVDFICSYDNIQWEYITPS